MDCREHCHENHRDHPGHRLCHHGEGHHLFVLAGIEAVAAAAHIRTVDAVVDGLQEEDLGEVEVVEGS